MSAHHEGSDPVPTVVHLPAELTYAADLSGRRLGAITYRLAPGRVVFLHTRVEPDAGGRGVGSLLARTALDDVIEQGLQITPLCPFVAEYIRRHPRYVEHVDDAHRASVTAGPPSE